jgi:uncharacterized protein YndB with AHSA1/START domain
MTMKLRVRMDAPLTDVYRALTDAGALRAWLAEHAEVSLPDRFCFWGRYTPEGAEPRQRLLHVDDRSLRFAWLLGGEETTVSISLAEHDDSTILSLTQSNVPSWEEAVAETSIRSTLTTFWALALSNLADYLLDRELTPKCDFTSTALRVSLEIAASRHEVYDSMVNPARFREWFGANIELEPHVGGRWSMGGFDIDPVGARILELEPDSKLSLDWGDMVQTWELADADGKTTLTFVHSGFGEAKPPYAGWLGSLSGIGELRRHHEVKDWRTIWLHSEIPGIPDGMLAIG